MSLAEKCKRISERRRAAPSESASAGHALRRSRSLDLRHLLGARPAAEPSPSPSTSRERPSLRRRLSMAGKAVVSRRNSSIGLPRDTDDAHGVSAFKSRVKALSGRLKSAASAYSLSSVHPTALLRRVDSTGLSTTSPRRRSGGGGSGDMSKELETSLRYVQEVTRLGQAQLLPASLSALLDVPLKMPGAGSAAYNSALVALLRWADELYAARVLDEASQESVDSKADLEKLNLLSAALKTAFQELLAGSSSGAAKRKSSDSGAATSVSSLDASSDALNNNKAPALPPRRTASPPRDSGIFDASSSFGGIVEEPDSDDDESGDEQRLFSDASMANMLEALNISQGGDGGDDAFQIAFGDKDKHAIEESSESKEESAEHRTTTEEVEEEDASGRKHNRKTTSSRQVFSTSSNSSSVVSSSTGLGAEGGLSSLQKMLQDSGMSGKYSLGKDGGLTVTETSQVRLGGRTSQRTLLENLGDGDEWPPKGFGFSTSTPKSGLDSLPAPPPVPTDDTDSASPMSSALLAKGNLSLSSFDASPKANGEQANPKGPRVRRTEEVKVEKAAAKSVNREARLNGELVGRQRTDALEARRLDMTRASTFDEAGKLVDVRGGGATDSASYRRRHAEDMRGRGSSDSPPPLPPKRHVDTYIGVFRPPDASLSVRSVDGSSAAEFGTSALASYVVLRDRLCQHEEALRQKRTTFSFANTQPGQDSQPQYSEETSEFANPGDAISDFFEGGPGYLNLKKFWRQAQDMIQFPKKLPIGPPPSVAEVTEGGRRADVPVAEVLGAAEASEFLLMRKSAMGDAKSDEVRGGGVDALIVYATQPGKHILLYQEAFLTTYRTFIKPLDLIRRLVWRYTRLCAGAEEDAAQRKAARNSFCLLVRVVHDLGNPDMTAAVVSEVNALTYRLLDEGNVALAKLLRSNLQPRLAALRPAPTPPLPVSDKINPLTGVLDFRSQELAEQLTCLDSALFQKIQAAEMLSWSREQSEAAAPNLVAFTEHFNRISFWVRSLVIRQADAKHRDIAALKFLKIMKHLRRLGNFNSYLAILSALESGPLRRLDWGRGVVDGLGEQGGIMDSAASFRNYRAALAATKPPCLPYIGLILQDLTFVHIGNPDRLTPEQTGGAEGVLNFGKRWQQFTILDAVRRFKAWPYSLRRDERVLAGLGNFGNPLSEDETWALSEGLKPRGSARK